MKHEQGPITAETGISHREFAKRFLFEDPHGPEAVRFRNDYRLDAMVTSGGEMDRLLRLSEWAYGQFYLFGRPTLRTENAFEILAASAGGHRFYCAHFAVVFCAAATALGWTARVISVRRPDEARRLSNHNIVEVWSKEQQKWLCFEPTYGGCPAIDGEPVSAFEVGRQWFARGGAGIQMILGPRRQIITRDDFPYRLRNYDDYGWTSISERSFTCYSCLAFVPSNRFFGAHGDRSIETWDDWPDLYVYSGAASGWTEDPCDLPPYYAAAD